VAEKLEILDRIEVFNGYAPGISLYFRMPAYVDVGDGRIRAAWTYVYSSIPEPYKNISDNDWRVHRGIRKDFVRALVNAHCSGKEEDIARELATKRLPWTMSGNPGETVKRLLPLCDAVEREELSERRLAQHSGKWVVIP